MPVYDAQYDLNNDGIINQRDMDILAGLIAGTIFNPVLGKGHNKLVYMTAGGTLNV